MDFAELEGGTDLSLLVVCRIGETPVAGETSDTFWKKRISTPSFAPASSVLFRRFPITS